MFLVIYIIGDKIHRCSPTHSFSTLLVVTVKKKEGEGRRRKEKERKGRRRKEKEGEGREREDRRRK